MQNPIGAEELKRAYQPNMAVGTAVAVALTTAGIGTVVNWANPQEGVGVEPLIVKTHPGEETPPFVLARASVEISQPGIPPAIGIPMPVPDNEVTGEVRMATVEEWTQLTMPSSAETENEPGQVIALQKLPKLIQAETPEYPSLAIANGLEGTVWVRALVGADGKVKDAGIVRRSRIDVGFEKAAVEAAFHNVYEPAVNQAGQPTATWINYSAEFKLERALRL